MSLKIRNVRYYDSLSEQVKIGDVLVDDGHFVSLGECEERAVGKTIDGTSYLLLPSFHNAHTHIAMGLLRGYGSDKNLSQWLNEYIWPMEKKLSDDDVYWGSCLGLLEMIASGTSAYMEMYDHTDAICQATAESGLYINICRGSVGLFDETQKGIKENIALYERWHGYDKGRFNVYFGPHAPNTCPPEYVEAMVKEAKERKTGIHIHLSETKAENDFILKNYGLSPTEYLDKLGVFDLAKPAAVAHCVYLSDKDRATLIRKNASLLHNPISNMKLASGISDVISYQNQGGLVAMGTDGASSNNTLDMLREMQVAALLHKVNTLNPEAMNAYEVLKMATENGAKALGFLNSGRIEVGYEANFILLNIDRPHYYPHYDHIANLVYSAKSSDIDYLFVRGRALYEKGDYLTLDKEKICFKAKEIANKLMRN